MTLRRTLASSTAVLFLLAALTACFGAPVQPQTPVDPGTSTYDLTGTSWTGTDSDGDFWGFEFQSDGTVGLTYNDDTYDDGTDTWNVAGGTVTITTVFDQGEVVFTGPVAEGTMNLAASYPGGSFTVTVTEQ